MKLENKNLLLEYFEENSHKYPDLTFAQFRDCCTTPYAYLKKEMENGELPTIRLKYFGTFVVYPKRVESILKKMTQQFKDLKISPKLYFDKKTIMDKYLENEN